MRSLTFLALVTGIAVAASAGQAQIRDRRSLRKIEYHTDEAWKMRTVCTGERAHKLQERLQREVEERDIARLKADEIRAAIIQLTKRSRQACPKGDKPAIWDISQRFDQIQARMARRD